MALDLCTYLNFSPSTRTLNLESVFARAVWIIFMFRVLALNSEIVASSCVHLNCGTVYLSILETVRQWNLSKSLLKPSFSEKLSFTEESTFEHTVEPSVIQMIIIIIIIIIVW
jgi:hypothetical protein